MFADDGEWDTTGYVVLMSDREWLRTVDGRPLAPVVFDQRSERDDVCNVSHQGGDVCRLLKGHGGKHVPFSGELVAVTGIIVECLDDLSALVAKF